LPTLENPASAYYLGAGEGGEKPYPLLADALASSKRGLSRGSIGSHASCGIRC